MKVLFKSTQIDVKEGKSAKGNDYYMATQTGLVTFDDETVKIGFNIPKGQSPYFEGEYDIDLDKSMTFGMDNYGNKFLTLKRDLDMSKTKTTSVKSA